MDRALSACPPILSYKYCMVYSHSLIFVSKAESLVELDFHCMTAFNKWFINSLFVIIRQAYVVQNACQGKMANLKT
jgi:hypothetical protein